MTSPGEIDAAASPFAEADVVSLAAADRPPRFWRRALRWVLLAIIAPYVIVATCVGLSVAATLHYFVTPQIVATFEAIDRALKR